MDRINARGLVLVGAGRMGGAMLKGWLARGLDPSSVGVIEPYPSDSLRASGVILNGELPENPAALVLAVKPQQMAEILPRLRDMAGPENLVLSVAAGVTLATYGSAFSKSPVVRAMPNTPAAIGQGITALIGNPLAAEADLALAEALLGAVGQTLRLEDEAQMDAVTGLSGSGPAYVFHMIEALAAAGEAEGLSPATALQLARVTVAGAGALAVHDDTPPSALREAVTSPNGTTAAGLAVLMDAQTGLKPLMQKTVSAATTRSRELGA